MNTTLSNGVAQKKEQSIKEDTQSCLFFKDMNNRGLNKERVMDAVKRAIILGEILNAPQDLTIFGKGLPKFGRKESGKGTKGQEEGQAKEKAKESPHKETLENVKHSLTPNLKPLAPTGHVAMVFVNTAPIVDTLMTVLKPGIKGRMRLSF